MFCQKCVVTAINTMLSQFAGGLAVWVVLFFIDAAIFYALWNNVVVEVGFNVPSVTFPQAMGLVLFIFIFLRGGFLSFFRGKL